MFDEILGQLIEHALDDKVPMVRWHLVMLFANLNLKSGEEEVISALCKLLEDKSVIVKACSISSLTILAISNPDKKDEIIAKLKDLEKHKSAAVRKEFQRHWEF